VELLKEQGLADVLVVGGGIIPDEDVPGLKDSGVAAIFGPGTRTEDIVKFIEEKVSKN
jgi:methylmalonyl-CoA mutase C-terminal domain/subunit